MHLQKEIPHIKQVTCSISEIENKVSHKIISLINISDVELIFQYEDPYIQFFLLTKNNAKLTSVKKKFLHNIIKMIHRIKISTKVKYNTVNLNSSILEWLKINIKVFEDPNDIISILQECNLGDEDKSFFRKFFGYNFIYKEYKRLLNVDSTLNLDTILILLDNNSICYNRLLEVYKKLNFYLENNILDKNFIFCCRVLQSLLNYDTKMFYNDYRDFLCGFGIYIVDLLYLPDTLKIFDLEDLELIIKLFRLIYPLGSDKFKKAMFVKCMDRSISIFTNTFDDTIRLIFTLQLIDIMDDIFEVTETVELLHDNLENFLLSKLLKTYKDYDFIITRYLEYKYKVLDKLKRNMNLNYDKIKLYNDLFNNDMYNEIILSNSSVLILDNIIDNLIILINNSKNKIQFLDILFLKSDINNISYLYLYLTALKDNYKYVLYFTVYYVNMKIDNIKYYEMMIKIYFMFIEVEDVYIDKSRIKIIQYILNNRIYLDVIVKEILRYDKHHKNVFILIYFTIKQIKELSQENFMFLYKYLIEEWKGQSKKPKNQYKKEHESNLDTNIFKYEQDTKSYKLKDFYIKVCLSVLTKFIESGCTKSKENNDETEEGKNISKDKVLENFNDNKPIFLYTKPVSKDEKQDLNNKISNSDPKTNRQNEIDCINLIKSKDYHNILIMLLYFKQKNENFDIIKDDIFEYVFTCSKKERKSLYKIIFVDKKVKKKYLD